MDRVISLLAALVGLIALGGAILVHTNSDTQRRELASLGVTRESRRMRWRGMLLGPIPAQWDFGGAKRPEEDAHDHSKA